MKRSALPTTPALALAWSSWAQNPKLLIKRDSPRMRRTVSRGQLSQRLKSRALLDQRSRLLPFSQIWQQVSQTQRTNSDLPPISLLGSLLRNTCERRWQKLMKFRKAFKLMKDILSHAGSPKIWLNTLLYISRGFQPAVCCFKNDS